MKIKDTFFSKNFSINCRGHLLDLSTPRIMGILNITPDSFYDGDLFFTKEEIAKRVHQLVSEGADIIDVGGYSSRPGAEHISEEEEYRRLERALSIIRKDYPDQIISVDTFRSVIARKVIEHYNVGIVNDISGGTMDENMFETIAALQVPYILMHIQGTPENMQKNPVYENLMKEIFYFFSKSIERLKSLGVNDVILDPGFGFGKTIAHNYELLHRLNYFRILEMPLLAGLSRKSMIYKPLHITPDEALNGSVVVQTIALLNGVNILRTHDVKAAREIVELVKLYRLAGENGL